MADSAQRFEISDVRRGRNGADPPQAIADQQVAEAINVDWYHATLARKRGGIVSVTTTSSPFTGRSYSSLFRHVPTTDETLAELWAVDDASTPHIGRLAGGTAWSTPALKDAPTGKGWDFTAASLNGKLFLAYKSAVARLHCWDGSTVRRTGIAVTTVPTVADTGGGAYPAVLRYYRTRSLVVVSSITVRRSEPSAIATFTPSGAGTAARISHGTLPNEGETHWEVEASVDGVTFYRLSPAVVVATATYDDSALVATYSANPLSALTGTFGLQKPYKFIAADQNRILGFGSWLATDPQNRVEWSAVLGSSDIGDDERVPLNNFQTLDENDSGVPTGLIGPVNGSFFAFKYRQVWKLTPTGDVTRPYSTLAISKVVGAVGPQAICIGEDDIGNPAVYWMSHRGPYRWGARGLEYLGRAIEDKTVGANGGVHLNLEALHVVAHTMWYGEKRQVMFWFATRP